MPNDIDDLAIKTGKLEIDAKIKKWNELPPVTKLEYIKMMDFDTEKISINRSTTISSDNIVKLNIGGTKFETSKWTLSFYGVFQTMLQDEIPKDDSGCIFIDRSPKHFELILNYIRDKKIEFPSSVQEVKEIQNEAQYYKMTGLEKMCRVKIRKMSEIKTLFNEVHVIETPNEHFQVIAKPPQEALLVIYYSIDKDGGTILPNGFNVKSFVDRYKDRLNIFFKPIVRTNGYGVVEPSQWTWGLTSSALCILSGTNKKGPWPILLEDSIREFFEEHSISMEAIKINMNKMAASSAHNPDL